MRRLSEAQRKRTTERQRFLFNHCYFRRSAVFWSFQRAAVFCICSVDWLTLWSCLLIRQFPAGSLRKLYICCPDVKSDIVMCQRIPVLAMSFASSCVGECCLFSGILFYNILLWVEVKKKWEKILQDDDTLYVSLGTKHHWEILW